MEGSLERGEGGNGRETRGVRKDKNWHMIVSFVFMYLEGPLCSDIMQICICDLIYLVKVILAIIFCYVDEKSILVVLEPTLLKICIVWGRTISLLVYNMTARSIQEELQKKCKIALMRKPYWPF